jgi:uncharacterized protein with gpF-like domain
VLQSLYDTVGTDFAKTTRKALEATLRKSWAYREQKAVFERVRALWDGFVNTAVASAVTEISNTTQEQIQRIIRKGLDSAMSYPEIGSMIRKLYEVTDAGVLPGDFETNYQYRPMLIARTEVHTASAKGSQLEAQSLEPELQPLGLKLKKRWVSLIDSRSRPEHAAIDGQERGLNDAYDVAGTKMSHPGDPNGGAGNVCNCRCMEMFVEVPIDA